ncbi:hypothetical protein Hanom_Chr11g01045851 [Helianthus anomalus]
MDTKNNMMISLGLSVSDHNMFIVHRETTLAVRYGKLNCHVSLSILVFLFYIIYYEY